ncbi:MAG: hypothetical protein SOZ46_06635, partial [Bullifex sp.]|nr:hypothetical protein [Bullifex sp.]
QSLKMMYDYKLLLVIRTPCACPWEQSVAEGNPEVSTKKRIVFEDPKGCKSKYVARNPDEKKVCEILIDGGLLVIAN